MALPFLDFFFPKNGAFHIFVLLIPYQSVNLIAPGEAFDKIIPMLIYPLNQIGRDSNVKGSDAATGEDVDAGMFLHLGQYD